MACGNYLEVEWCETCGEIHVSRAYSCKDRHCPKCQATRSFRLIGEAYNIIQHVDLIRYEPILLTLTLQNVMGENLDDLLNTFSLGWTRLTKRRWFQRSVWGFIKTLEITFNKEDQTFHPHLHVIIFTKPIYWKAPNYKSRQEWAEIWQEVCGVDYFPHVWVQSLNTNVRDSEDYYEIIKRATAYTLKYTLKGGVADLPINEICTYVDTMRWKRSISYGMNLAKMRKGLHQKDDHIIKLICSK